jgi:diguanylate cyclase (GGDEF)-like protein
MAFQNLRAQPRRRRSTIQVIDGLAEITRYLDKELIEHSLLSTLSEFDAEQEIRLYRVLSHENELQLSLSAHYFEGVVSRTGDIRCQEIEKGLCEAILAALDEGDPTALEDPDTGAVAHIHPVFDQHGNPFSLLVQIGPNLQHEDQRLINGLLRIYSNYLSLLDLSQKDKLTSLLNRDRLQTAILQILGTQRIVGNDAPLRTRRNQDKQRHWLAVIDIDHFKKINDGYGHLIGDEVLIIFARLMHEVFRNDDLLFRYGGEEFVAIIRTDTQDNARSAFERFRGRVQSHNFPTVNDLTASLGVVEIKDQETPADVIDEADKAMYHVKQNGRNRLAFYQDLVESGDIQPKTSHACGDIDLF